jgi:general secretion pathway protein D
MNARLTILTAAFLAVSSSATLSRAQGKPPAKGPDKELSKFDDALEFEPRAPGYKVAFSLQDADLAELVRVISQLTGRRFIFGGKVKSIKASVYSPQKVTVAEAYQQAAHQRLRRGPPRGHRGDQ